VARIALYLVPVLTVAFAAFALLVVGGTRPIVGASLSGGPTQGAKVLSWRLEVSQELGAVQAPLGLGAVAVEVNLGDGRRASWRGSVDVRGDAFVAIQVPGAPVTGPVDVTVSSPLFAHDLARGSVELTRDDWIDRAQWRGGWIKGRRTGQLEVEVAAARGMLAVPFADPLLVQVRDGGVAVPAARLELQPEGLEVQAPHRGKEHRTGPMGRALVRVAPNEHVCALRVTAHAPDGRKGEWYSTVPVLPGALHASWQKRGLVVRSPVPRERAYYALVSERQRWAGGCVKLSPDSEGGATGFVNLAKLPPQPLWAIVGGDSDLLPDNAVGWPLEPATDGAERLTASATINPRRSLTVPDQLLLDGMVSARRLDERRRRRARGLTALYVGLALALVAILIARRARESQSRLEEHLARNADGIEGAERIAPPRRAAWWTLLVALLCVGLGFLMIMLLVMYGAY
jgi:hypothetical protein